METDYQVIIIGAGPAGVECARQLAQKKIKTLLIEKGRSFESNNFSSAGAPLEIMSDFNLPTSVIGSYWNQLLIASSQDRKIWRSTHPSGVILDFAKLRHFLAEEFCCFDGQLKLGCSYQNHLIKNGCCHVTIRDLEKRQLSTVTCQLIIDATGTERAVINSDAIAEPAGVTATGVEFLVEAEEEDYQAYAQTLSLFIGAHWMPQGYSWVFPMQSPFLKIGVARYFVKEEVVPHHKSIQYYMDGMLNKALKHPIKRLVDRHGKTLHYTYRRRDQHYKEGVLAIGDAISTLNPMAGEGIRHAMHSARFAAEAAQSFLNGNHAAFHFFERKMARYCGIRWRRSELHMRTLFRQPNDQRIESVLSAFKKLSMPEMLDFAFQYNWKSSFKFYRHFILAELKRSINYAPPST